SGLLGIGGQDGGDISVRANKHTIARLQPISVADKMPGIDDLAMRTDMMNVQPRTGDDGISAGVMDKQRPMRPPEQLEQPRRLARRPLERSIRSPVARP